MKIFKSKTIDGFAGITSLKQNQLLAIRAGNCCDDGSQEPPDPPKQTTAVNTSSVMGG